MEEVERSGASVEEALEAALQELGISEQEAQIEIVREARSGFLGLSSQPAIVRVRRAVASRPGASEGQAALAVEFLEGLLDEMGLAARVGVGTEGGVTYVDVWAQGDPEEMGVLIGRQGRVLAALQDLVGAYVQRASGERCRVQVDVEDYRKRRRAQLVRRAREVARRVRRTGRPEALEPMSAFERKIVHDAVSAVAGVESVSEGAEPERRVVIRRRAAPHVSRETRPSP
ncbi:MAG TPA: RNA-binding cell elongation regulator Jag/EloR [Actinomycetota bacterium]|nr:RNA-binding cell elongation regulator Jag/EloR [Actinomycetota bacterium]